ncbi:hypothetical protein Tco_0331557 [Tanacetum coccineum]
MRAREKRNKPPTQAQQRKLYCNYLKNMEGYTLKQLKGFKFEDIKDMFDKAFKRVNTFVDYKTELVDGSEKRADDSTKRASIELEQEVAKKQKIDDDKVDDDQEEARMKELINIVPDEEEVVIDAIPLATKPTCIVDWKIIKERRFGNSVKTESPVWRTLQNEKVLIWKLFDSCGVHFLRLQSMHIFMVVEKSFLNSSQNSSRILEGFESILLVMLMLLVYKLLLLVFRVNAAGTKLQLLTELQLPMDKD